jgi:hypothetical protein
MCARGGWADEGRIRPRLGGKGGCRQLGPFLLDQMNRFSALVLASGGRDERDGVAGRGPVAGAAWIDLRSSGLARL